MKKEITLIMLRLKRLIGSNGEKKIIFRGIISGAGHVEVLIEWISMNDMILNICFNYAMYR